MSLFFALGACVSVGRVKQMTEPLVGELTRQQIEQNLVDWRQPKHPQTILQSNNAFIDIIPGAHITVYLGTWCSDSKYELMRFWRALDTLKTTPPFTISYIGVDREKKAPQISDTLDLHYVPTFVVSRKGEEIGRVVESAPRGIEIELKSLLSGQKQGVISGPKL